MHHHVDLILRFFSAMVGGFIGTFLGGWCVFRQLKKVQRHITEQIAVDYNDFVTRTGR